MWIYHCGEDGAAPGDLHTGSRIQSLIDDVSPSFFIHATRVILVRSRGRFFILLLRVRVPVVYSL